MDEIKMENSLCEIANDYIKKSENISNKEIEYLDAVELDKYIKKYGKFCKLVDFGGNSTKRIITNLIVCDGDKIRNNRLNLFNNDYKFIGVASSLFSNNNYFIVLFICSKLNSLNEKNDLLDNNIKKLILLLML